MLADYSAGRIDSPVPLDSLDESDEGENVGLYTGEGVWYNRLTCRARDGAMRLSQHPFFGRIRLLIR